LAQRITALEGNTTNLRNEFNEFRNGVPTAQEFAELEEKVNDHEGRIATLEKKDREENCKKDGTNCPKGMKASPVDASLGLTAGVFARMQGAGTTVYVGGEAGVTLWPGDRVGVSGTLAIAHGFNKHSSRMPVIGTIGPKFALTPDRNHTLTVAVVGAIEQSVQANDADFIGAQVAYQLVFADWVYLRPAIGGGAARANLYPNGVRGEVGPWVGAFHGSLGVGGTF
jgi:hypothetical protein